MKKTIALTFVLAALASFAAAQSALTVRFGQNGKAFTMAMESNETAVKLVRDVGNQSWNLPIYNFSGYEGADYYQYYDIPRRYTYTPHSDRVIQAKAGEVYYSHPNRIILFFHDAKVDMELTKIGQIEATAEFVRAVEDNPTLEYWGNKIVVIQKK